jgi:hypothetical protein
MCCLIEQSADMDVQTKYYYNTVDDDPDDDDDDLPRNVPSQIQQKRHSLRTCLVSIDLSSSSDVSIGALRQVRFESIILIP